MMDKKIVGYTDKISVSPGECIQFKVSCEEGVGRYRADIVRLISGDTQPGAPGYLHETVDTVVSGGYPARKQETYVGSYALVNRLTGFDRLDSLNLSMTIYPTMPLARRACLISKLARASGFALWTDPESGLVLTLGNGKDGFHEFSVGKGLIAREWYRVQASYDGQTGEVCLEQRTVRTHWLDPSSGDAKHPCESDVVLRSNSPLLIAAVSHREAREKPVAEAIFNGRIERPIVASRVLDRREVERLRQGPIPADLGPVVCAAWDFSKAMDTDRAVDISPNHLDGEFINLPIRAVRSSAWDGSEMNFSKAPEQYAAVHFLEDSLYDCEWETDFELEIPTNTKSGFYAAHLTSDDQEDHIPFFVRPPRDRATAPLAVLVPTASYIAYSNKRGSVDSAGMEVDRNSMVVVFPEDRYLQRHPELGNSMYDDHADGTGVCYASRLRPILDFRPKHGSLWQFSADMHLTDWLEREKVSYDVITDEDLHQEGLTLLGRYSCVMTCSHPEYYSTPMWDALFDYLQDGGRLMYMGGNGFYWRVAYRDDKPGAMEMRRAEDGSRSWASEPGEYYMSFTGEYGGLWWRCGRPPQMLVGNGFIAQGFDFSSYYRRQPDSFDKRAAFIFEGVGEGEKIGDFGLIGGGAAGWELDVSRHKLGTPPHALKLASSESHTDSYLHVNEDIGHMFIAIGGRDDPLVRADMMFFETPNGGAVFSTGSITWCGSLYHNQNDNNVSRITRNVLNRFLDPVVF
jgi:N,N-dimethylformamidase